jgi:cellulose synthase/poly-beta-1,6-N-acetylglucosamine synthase-like glycosyltransferase/peptidoglycan/xylan/chitin deacetylase (PgdA/CDA1 family)
MPIPTALQRARLGGATVEYDENGTASFAYETEGGGRQTVRIFDSVSVFNSLARVQFEGASGSSGPRPLGWALWRLGTETLDVWRVLERRGSLDSSVAHSLRHVVAAPGITYIGAGEAIAYSRDGKDGHRRLDYSGTDGTINASSIEELPSPMTIRRYGAGHERRIALTFDDGPEPPYTPRVLAILKRYGIRATFFVNGLNAIRYPAFLKRIEREGHEIGHHTFSHPNISRISQRRFRLELRSLQVFVESLIGRRMVLFRPPYSEAAEPIEPDEAKPLRLLGQEGYLLVTSHVDPRDWSGKTADEIERHTVELARGEQGHVVLLHDGGGDRTATVEALPAIIEGLRSEGFEIVPLAELLGLERDQVMPRISGQRFVLTRAYRVVFSVAGSVLRVFGILFGVCIAIGLGRAGLMIVLSVAGKLRPRRSARERSVEGVKASVIVPAYNEEKVVTMTVDSILGSTYPDFEILVVDDGSTDDTLGVLTRAYQNHPKVRICSVPNGGKSAALNFGIARSTGEVVVMLDADTVLGRETLGNLIAPFADDSVGAVAGNAKVGNRDKSLTRCQALEYITGQNIEKRAYDVINGISVVPGAVGAWRRSVLVEEGGLAHDTLAEDAELTFRVLRRGYRVVYREDAPGYTEAPDTVRGFVKQRVRWMYGTLQTAWKHRDITFRPRFGALGLVTAPSIYLFQLFFPLFSVIVEIMLLSNAGFHLYQIAHHPTGETASPASLQVLLTFYLLFLGLELAMSLVAFLMEKHERKHLLLWVVVQRFYYRPILSFVALRTLYHILRGRPPGWNKPTRTATVRVDSFAESRGHVQPHEVETPAIIAARRAG